METCNHCQKETAQYFILKAIPSKCTESEILQKHYPRYGVMVKQICKNCGAYIRFAKQTPEVIEIANKQAEKDI